MRSFFKWILSAMLAFEPALASQGATHLQEEFKRFIEISELTKREVSLQELYNKFSAFLPYEEQQKLQGFIQRFGATKLPKMDLSTFKNAGLESYKLSASFSGKSGIFEFIGSKDEVFKINGQSFSPVEASDIERVLVNASMPPTDVAQIFKLPPAQKSVFLSAEEIAMMSREDQIKYIKKFHDLLANMEVAQKSFSEPKKTADSGLLQKLELYSQMLFENYAWALSLGSDCLLAGHTSKVQMDKSGRWVCGAVDKGERIDPAYRLAGDGSACPDDKPLACNKDLFGSGKYCVPAAIDSTKQCSQLVSGKDIPELNKENKAAFEDLKKKAEAQALQLEKICKTIPSSAKDRSANLVKDQAETCSAFNERYSEIKSWSCDENVNKEFNKKYPKLCAKQAEAAAQAQGKGPAGADAGPAPAPGTTPAPQPPGAAQGPAAGEKLEKCDSPKNYPYVFDAKQCQTQGNYKPVEKVFCLGDKNQIVPAGTYECLCPDGGKFKARGLCDGGSGKSGSAEEGAWSKTKSWMSKNSKWLVPLSFGVFGLLVYHWAARQSAKQYYQYLNPTDQKTPTAPTNPTAPVPRGTT